MVHVCSWSRAAVVRNVSATLPVTLPSWKVILADLNLHCVSSVFWEICFMAQREVDAQHNMSSKTGKAKIWFPLLQVAVSSDPWIAAYISDLFREVRWETVAQSENGRLEWWCNVIFLLSCLATSKNDKRGWDWRSCGSCCKLTYISLTVVKNVKVNCSLQPLPQLLCRTHQLLLILGNKTSPPPVDALTNMNNVRIWVNKQNVFSLIIRLGSSGVSGKCGSSFWETLTHIVSHWHQIALLIVPIVIY